MGYDIPRSLKWRQVRTRVDLLMFCNITAWCVEVKVDWWEKGYAYSVAFRKIVHYDTVIDL